MNILDWLVQKVSSGSVSAGDWEILANFAKDKDLVVELGTNTGTTAALLSYCARRVATIDVFDKLSLIEDASQRATYTRSFENNKNTFNNVKDRLSKFTNVDVIQNSTKLALGLFEDASIDMLFIDADHSYTGVKNDYVAWHNKVRLGGHYVFHDVVDTFGVLDYYKHELTKDLTIREVTYQTSLLTSIKVFERVA